MPHRYELPIFSLLAVVLVLLPLPWHWKARNVATLSLIAWLAVTNLIRGINAIVWMDNIRIHHRVWCDISTKVFMGVAVALPACSLCITRNLEHIASTRVAVTTAADKRRRRIIDLCITVGFPVLTMALHYVVQGHRFDILEDIGCQPHVYISIPALFILYIPPLVISVASLVYAALALRHFIIRRAEFERHLRDSHSALNTSRYMRLMALAVSEMVWGTTLGGYIIFINIKQSGLRPWTSWADVHYNFSRVAIFPAFLLDDWQRLHMLLSWWVTPATAFLFFLFFGFSEEALEGYASAFRWVLRTVFRIQPSPKAIPTGSYSKGNSLPHFMKNKPLVATHPDDLDVDFPELKLDLPPNYSTGPEYPTKPTFTRNLDVETGSARSLTYDRPGLVSDNGGDAISVHRLSLASSSHSLPPDPAGAESAGPNHPYAAAH